MALKYLARNSVLYKDSQDNSAADKLIYGEEVETLGPKENGRTKVRFRSKAGWMKTQHLASDPVLETYFIDVGQGDSTFIVTPGRKKILVDGGESDRALRFLAWKYRLEDPAAQQVTIDLLVLTHADEDHIAGLVHVISHPKIKIKKIIHSGLATFKAGIFDQRLGNISTIDGTRYLVTSHNHLDELDDGKLANNFRKWKQAIEADGGVDYLAVNSSTGFIDIGDPGVTLEVIGPRLDALPGNQPAYRWFGDHSHTINGHSVVLRLACSDVSILFAGDLNTDGEEHLLQDQQIATKMDANVLKAPHHGSHEFSRKWLDAVNPQVSVISSGDDTDHGHPRAVFLGAMGNSSRQPAYIFSTEIAANFVKMEQKLGREAPDDSDEPTLRELYKRRLHGMINVRTNGKTLYAARRVASSYMWEYYVIDNPAARSK